MLSQLINILPLLLLLCIAAGQFWLVYKAFTVDARWGFVSLLIPPMAIVFAAKHWEVARRPCLLIVRCFFCLILVLIFLH